MNINFHMIYGAEFTRTRNSIERLENYFERNFDLAKEDGKIIIVHPNSRSGVQTAKLYQSLLGNKASIIPTGILDITKPKNGRNIFKAIAKNIEADIIRPILPNHTGIVIVSPAEMLGKTIQYLKVNPDFRKHFCPSREMLSSLSDGQFIHCDGKNKKIVLI